MLVDVLGPLPKPRVAGSSPAGGASRILEVPHCHTYPAFVGTLEADTSVHYGSDFDSRSVDRRELSSNAVWHSARRILY